MKSKIVRTMVSLTIMNMIVVLNMQGQAFKPGPPPLQPPQPGQIQPVQPNQPYPGQLQPEQPNVPQPGQIQPIQPNQPYPGQLTPSQPPPFTNRPAINTVAGEE
jgi:hypothetical protein